MYKYNTGRLSGNRFGGCGRMPHAGAITKAACCMAAHMQNQLRKDKKHAVLRNEAITCWCSPTQKTLTTDQNV